MVGSTHTEGGKGGAMEMVEPRAVKRGKRSEQWEWSWFEEMKFAM